AGLQFEDFAAPDDFAAHKPCHPDEWRQQITEREQPEQSKKAAATKHKAAGHNSGCESQQDCDSEYSSSSLSAPRQDHRKHGPQQRECKWQYSVACRTGG